MQRLYEGQSRGVAQTSVLLFVCLECILGTNSCEWKNKQDNKYAYGQYLLSLEITKCQAFLSACSQTNYVFKNVISVPDIQYI